MKFSVDEIPLSYLKLWGIFTKFVRHFQVIYEICCRMSDNFVFLRGWEEGGGGSAEAKEFYFVKLVTY